MRVVKIGGRAQSNPKLAATLRDAWNAEPGELCIVHGGGDEVSALQRALGREAAFVGGRRVTSQADIELLRMVLSGVVNKRLVSAFVAAGLPAIGISGEDGGLIGAELIDAASLGFAGRPVNVKVDLLRTLLKGGYLPVISPLAADATSSNSSALNVNGDDAAAAIAAALGADELLLIVDVEGVRGGDGEISSNLSIETARDLAANGIAVGGMAAKLESAESALRAGVGRVRICNLAGLGDDEHGTLITLSQSAVL